MARSMMVDQVRFYASVVRPALVLKFSRIELTWHQSWALASALATYSLRFVEVRRVLAFERWTSRARFANHDVMVTVIRTNDGLFVSRSADGFDPRQIHTDDMSAIVKFIDEAVSEVPRTEDGWWKIR